jgi:Na+(H+)/acetate symporter ActP
MSNRQAAWLACSQIWAAACVVTSGWQSMAAFFLGLGWLAGYLVLNYLERTNAAPLPEGDKP